MRRQYEQPVKRLEKLSKQEKEELLGDLLIAFQCIQSPHDVVLFIQDLFTQREVAHLAKRLRIAKLLLTNCTYEEIEKELHVSHSTVAKVGAWLTEKGDGFRHVISHLPKETEPQEESVWAPMVREWQSIKRRYPRYYWPEILLEEVIKLANKRQKEHLRRTLSSLEATLEEKSDLHKSLSTLLSAPYKNRKKRKKYATT
ncbi:hypothetical protein A2973_02320 [Candidatus Gottesmanbacteria bacterium RIFCSPLOWO2_01_FULL_49_10]|uniref:TrpR like protein, YerC/YecD n=1 Tax=Candidatus Gottesmanbacteria bacterium RIFCSPLOWO2_01_FULL_49_10 TaxID=1798396 RepID=A0A1F6AXH9_9BACT|nr:MAG: hypothetical protein A2973_02320 [Candidatus Gottesmanbacteria bacterium RIFCSPLOWO2_01_FULL_49_10]